MFRKFAFAVVSIGEIAFCLWALTQPLGYEQYSYGFNLFLGGFTSYLVGAAILSSISSTLFWYKKRLPLVTICSLALAVFWLAVALSPMLLGVFTISLPLYISMSFIRFLMAIIAESESKEMVEDI